MPRRHLKRDPYYSIIQDPLNGHKWQVRVRMSLALPWGDAGDACLTRAEAESKLHDFREYDRGYNDQWEWLEGQAMSKEAAEHALTSRNTTLEDNPYNNGGTQATRDYVLDHPVTRRVP